MKYTEKSTARKSGLTYAEVSSAKGKCYKKRKGLIDFHGQKGKWAVHFSILLFAQLILEVSYLMHGTFFFLLLWLMTL